MRDLPLNHLIFLQDKNVGYCFTCVGMVMAGTRRTSGDPSGPLPIAQVNYYLHPWLGEVNTFEVVMTMDPNLSLSSNSYRGR